MHAVKSSFLPRKSLASRILAKRKQERRPLENKISVWSVGDFGSLGPNGEYQGEPQLLCDIRHHGDVMDMQTLSVNQQWERAHYHVDPDTPFYGGASCTGVICNNPEIVTVGEDGRINLFRADHREAVRTIENADSSTLHAVTFLRTTEILTVNSIGQLKIWDFRQQRNEPSQIFSLTGDRIPLHCVDRHPNQQHIVATGGQDGMLSIWDVRQGSMPVSLLNAHEAEKVLKEQHSDAETTEPEPPKKKNLLPVASDSDDENECALVHTALDSYQAQSVISMDACPLE
ncbi:Nucleoporin Nup43 [Chelonia mydas]|uniref:Nucleoporin Nup43 n=1 Tax=Chelonia mydas TaxID=8469 RepID=M7C1V7_CHEMY|nr:Nucleoporin Nup43 [Chelonia mydas]